MSSWRNSSSTWLSTTSLSSSWTKWIWRCTNNRCPRFSFRVSEYSPWFSPPPLLRISFSEASHHQRLVLGCEDADMPLRLAFQFLSSQDWYNCNSQANPDKNYKISHWSIKKRWSIRTLTANLSTIKQRNSEHKSQRIEMRSTHLINQQSFLLHYPSNPSQEKGFLFCVHKLRLVFTDNTDWKE